MFKNDSPKVSAIPVFGVGLLSVFTLSKCV